MWNISNVKRVVNSLPAWSLSQSTPHVIIDSMFAQDYYNTDLYLML